MWLRDNEAPEDISGYFIKGSPAFTSGKTDDIVYATDENTRLARWFDNDRQYTFTAVGAGENFNAIAEEIRNLTTMQK